MERPGSSGEQEKIFAVETQMNLSHWWVSLYFQHHIPIINNNHSSSEFVYSKSTDQCCFLNSSLTCIRSTPSLFLPVFLSPPSPQYLSRGVCSRSILFPVSRSFSRSFSFCSNLARRPISIMPSLISGQFSGLFIFNLRPRDLAVFGS